MGKLVQVIASVTEIDLPPIGAYFQAGETTTLTDREFAGLTTDQLGAIVVLASGLADPVRSSNPNQPSSLSDVLRAAKGYADDAVQGLAQIGVDPPAEMATHSEVSEGDEATLTSATAYADTLIANEVTARTQAVSTALSTAEAYTDTQVATVAAQNPTLIDGGGPNDSSGA